MNNGVFAITAENVGYEAGNKLEVRRNYLVLEPNYHTTTFFQKINQP